MSPESRANIRGARILIVDDVPSNLDVLRALLEPAGYSILAAPTGERGLEIAIRSQPELILLDWVLPGMDGLEVCRRLKADPGTREIPVLFLSALGEEERIEEGFAAGANDYLVKPFRKAEVLAKVEGHLRLQRRLRQLQERAGALEREVRRKRKEQDG